MRGTVSWSAAGRGRNPRAGITSLAGDLAGLDARGAHVHALGRAVDRDAAALDVRVPAAPGTAVREGDVVAEDRPLAAYVADGSHSSLHLTRVTRAVSAARADQAAVEAYPMASPSANSPDCHAGLLCCQV